MTIKRLFNSADVALQRVIVPVIVFLSILVAGGLVLGIVMRSVFNQPMFGLEEIVLFSVMWLYMLGATLASRERSHLRADVAATYIKNPRYKRLVRILAALITLVVACAFVVWSFDLFLWGLAKGQSTPVFQLPMVISQASLIFASILIMFYAVRDLINDFNEDDC